ncbi:MAG: hypothetical protein JNJ57_22105 [Saprospiraceae bacterium]|nr:hypothetical protein [Saprospiraceae bacterium]
MKFPKLTHIAMSERGGISATHNTFQGILFDGKDLFYSNKYDLPDILDRMGAGDAMMAGLIYGLSKKSMDAATLINFAGASAAMKHYIRGDFNLSSLHEIRSLMDGNSGSKVHR